MIPYGRQCIEENDIEAVVSVLRSDYLTTGPKVVEFEKAICDLVGVKHAVAVSSGTAALHCAMYAIDIKPGDEVIVPAMTFAATANCVVFQGGTPVFVDVDADTLLIDPKKVEAAITENTRAIVAVDYAGQTADYDELIKITKKYGLYLVGDACHALGAVYRGKPVGSIADITLFSFHPVKHITTGEGGMALTNNDSFTKGMRRFRNHGISSDFRAREVKGSWHYEMVELGFNYRITDIQCALGISQLKKLPRFLKCRCEIATIYDEILQDIQGVQSIGLRSDVLPAKKTLALEAPCPMPSASHSIPSAPGSMPSLHAWHLYVIKLSETLSRAKIFADMRKAGLGVNVHYIPVHLHPFYRIRFQTAPGLCPVAEEAYERILSLPIWPGMSDENVQTVLEVLKKTTEYE